MLEDHPHVLLGHPVIQLGLEVVQAEVYGLFRLLCSHLNIAELFLMNRLDCSHTCLVLVALKLETAVGEEADFLRLTLHF